MSMSENYRRIEAAIQYINTHHKNQPGLDEVAREVHLSPFHFQRLFTEWAGVSPKKFLQYTTLEHAKHMLSKQDASLADATFETGLSGSSRLHDLFISIEGMTPGEFKKGGEDLHINYSFAETPFGEILVASTSKGICHMSFVSEQQASLQILKAKFPNAKFVQIRDHLQQSALQIFTHERENPGKIKLHLKGTPFQLKVWESLIKIPSGRLSTYGAVASSIQHPHASRAVGTAIGDNPVALLIPCHRVIRASGNLGGYMWGETRKAAIIAWEAVHTEENNRLLSTTG